MSLSLWSRSQLQRRIIISGILILIPILHPSASMACHSLTWYVDRSECWFIFSGYITAASLHGLLPALLSIFFTTPLALLCQSAAWHGWWLLRLVYGPSSSSSWMHWLHLFLVVLVLVPVLYSIPDSFSMLDPPMLGSVALSIIPIISENCP